MIENHYRAMKTILTVFLIIVALTSAVIAAGKASPGLGFTQLGYTVLVGSAIIVITWLIVKRNLEASWSKWLIALSLLLIIITCRLVSPVYETVNMLYLVIILSLLYFDVRLTIAACLACIVSDIMLLKALPYLIPEGSSTLPVRYGSFVFATVAASAGSIAAERLLNLAARREETAKENGMKLQNEANYLSGKADDLGIISNELIVLSKQNFQAFEQISANTQEIAQTATDQAGETDETSRTINEMMTALQSIGSNVVSINALSSDFVEIVSTGNNYMQEQRNSLKNVSQANEEVSQAVGSLQAQSAEIENIVKAITNIAEQTSLLALNAAIEAARAGEQGKGFAVVADEVRKLADESGEAAQNINKIISEVQEHTRQTVAKMDEANRAFGNQVGVVEQSKQLFDKIDKHSLQIDESLQGISAVVEELIASSEIVGQAVESISSGSQQLAASSQEMSAITDEQLKAMKNMVESVQKLNLLSHDLKENATNMSS